MMTGRHGIYTAVVGQSIFLPGGATREGVGATDVHEAYVIAVPLPPPPEPIPLQFNRH